LILTPSKQKTIPPGSGKNCRDQRNCGWILWTHYGHDQGRRA